MQRRWAAVCLAFFLVTAAGAYGSMAVAEGPELDIEGDTYQDNDTFVENGTTYTVHVSEGAGELVSNETVSEEATWDNGSVVEYRDGEYNVTVEPGTDPSRFALVEEFDVQAILENDSEVENQTYTAEDGTEFVRYRDGSTEPLEEYLPEPDTAVFAEGEAVDHGNYSKNVANVTNESVELTWEAEVEQTATLAHGENVTIDNRTYVATFPSADTVKLSEDVKTYQAYQADYGYYEDRLSGLNYVVIFSLVTAFILTTTAFLPRRG